MIETDILYDPVTHRFYGTPAFLAGSTFYTMDEFYNYAIDIEDNPENLDAPEFFTLDANQLTYRTNGDLYIQQELFKRLLGASLDTTGYTGIIRLIQLDLAGYTNFIDSDIGNPILGGTTGDSGTLLDFDNSQRKIWVRVDDFQAGGDEFDVAEPITTTGGTGQGTSSGASSTGEELFANLASVGGVNNGFPYIYRGTPNNVTEKIVSWWGEGNFDGNGATAPNNYHVDIMIKVREAGSLIDNGDIVIFNRNWQDLFDHATANLSGGGRNIVALATSPDGNITLTEAQAEEYFNGTSANVLASFGSFQADVDDNSVNENYDVQINADNVNPGIYYQVAQWLTYKDSTQTLNGEDGESYISANGSYIVNKTSPLGSLSAGTFIGAQGVLVINSGNANYSLTDSAGTEGIVPPPQILVGFGSGLVAGDFVAVFPRNPITNKVDKQFFTFQAASSGATTLLTQSNIPKDIPQSGTIFVVYADKSEQIISYSTRGDNQFNLNSALTSNVLATDNGYPAFLYKVASGSSETNSLQYVTDRDCIYRVRNSSSASINKIKRVRVNNTFTNSGGVIPASRNPETLAA